MEYNANKICLPFAWVFFSITVYIFSIYSSINIFGAFLDLFGFWDFCCKKWKDLRNVEKANIKDDNAKGKKYSQLEKKRNQFKKNTLEYLKQSAGWIIHRFPRSPRDIHRVNVLCSVNEMENSQLFENWMFFFLAGIE